MTRCSFWSRRVSRRGRCASTALRRVAKGERGYAKEQRTIGWGERGGPEVEREGGQETARYYQTDVGGQGREIRAWGCEAKGTRSPGMNAVRAMRVALAKWRKITGTDRYILGLHTRYNNTPQAAQASLPGTRRIPHPHRTGREPLSIPNIPLLPFQPHVPRLPIRCPHQPPLVPISTNTPRPLSLLTVLLTLVRCSHLIQVRMHFWSMPQLSLGLRMYWRGRRPQRLKTKSR